MMKNNIATQHQRPVNPKQNKIIVDSISGVLLVNKAAGSTSFSLVSQLRRRLDVKTIGHSGTLDPMATGVMILLIGRQFTQLSDKFLLQDKEYRATIHLGIQTETYDGEGAPTAHSDLVPTLEEVINALTHFQGKVEQIPPMYSAKKQQGKKLYELARKGLTVERPPVSVTMQTSLIRYEYPEIEVLVACSKGTYIRTVAHDMGQKLGCGAYLSALSRTRSGKVALEDCIDSELLLDTSFNLHDTIRDHTRKLVV